MSTHENAKNNSVFKIALNLAAACFISGAIISGVNAFTEPIAKEQEVMLKSQSMQSLVKDADSFKPVVGKPELYMAFKGGKAIAYVSTIHSRGYGGDIKILVAVKPDGRVIDYEILSHNETPGLGDGAAKPAFKNQFCGKEPKNLVVVKGVKDTKNIDALTGATITSKAVTKGIKEFAEQIKKMTGGK